VKPTVLLFDIDGTLMTTGGAGRRALARAFGDHHGRPDACAFPLDGMTDRRIVRLGLEALSVEVTDAAMDGLIRTYLAHLERELASAHDAEVRLLPGMRNAVEAAGRERNVAVGLGTGNVRAGAKTKLERVGFHAPFPFGGFGCDHEERPALIRVGAERGAAQLGDPLEACRVVIIGDTPKDVAAALAMGAECLGVATGSYSVEQLEAAGATRAFTRFDAPGALDALLGG
jgi:phosphoglycolate phosphatase-like HAD superfamily hydrolase